MHAHVPPSTIRILYAGEEFSRGYPLAQSAAVDLLASLASKNPHGVGIEVVKCSREQLLEEAPKAHVIVPLMSRIDAKVIEAGAKGNLKLIMQFGVGLEGVDVAAGVLKSSGVLSSSVHLTTFDDF
jgi:lactate dehydrogenase-like 2-hydroxyacid dehydrogenase